MRKRPGVLAVMTVVSVLLAAFLWTRLPGAGKGAGPGWREVRVSRRRMGTVVEIAVFAGSEESAKRAIERAFQRIEELEGMLSGYRSDSEVSRCNRLAAQRPVPVSDPAFQVMKAALRFSELSGGAFDITVGPCVELWRRCGREGQLPTQGELARASEAVGWRLVRLDSANSRVRFAGRGVEIDLGGIAKGYIIDQAIGALKRSGVSRALVNAGGDVYAAGLKPGGRRWVVGIQDPRHPQSTEASVTTLYLSDSAVATSGNYRRFTVIEGRRYSHIIDPRTGLPADAIPSVTVTAPDATTADALATALSVLGVEDGLDLVERLPGVEALMITLKEGELVFHPSSGFPG